MTAVHREAVQNSLHEPDDLDGSSQGSEATKELFRRESPSPRSTPTTPKSPPKPSSRIPLKPSHKPSPKENAAKKKSNSGIPLRLKTAPVKPPKSSYRYSPPAPMGPVINKNTLEVQFMNNKKRLLQMHAELMEKQRPLVEMHKSLMRTKKQLEGLGKKVVLEDLKVMSLKLDSVERHLEGAGENPVEETALSLKNSIEGALEECAQVLKECLGKGDNVVKMLESASRSGGESPEVEAEVEGLKKEKEELEKKVDSTIKENEKKIEEVISNWEKAVKTRSISTEQAVKIADMEETIKQQQKYIQETEDNLHSLTRKYEDRKVTYEKSLNEMQDKYNKLEDELKREKKNANDNLMKSRTLRGRVVELETKIKDGEDKSSDVTNKLKHLQEQFRKKEIQWMKEKEELKKSEALLQQKYTEKQSQLDTRTKELELLQKNAETQQQNFCRNFETQLEIKDQEFAVLEKEKEVLVEKSQILEEQLEEAKRKLEVREKEVDQLRLREATAPAIEYKPSESHWVEVMEYKQKVQECEEEIEKLNGEVDKMQNSLKAHAKLAAALKMEKDNAITYTKKLREILQEARDELDFKTKTIYKIHEKLVLKEKACDKLTSQLKAYETMEATCDKWKSRCQICMGAMAGDKDTASCVDTDMGKSCVGTPQYVSESLIGMSVKKVDHLRARLDNLKKMKLPISPSGISHSWSRQSCPGNLRRKIELRGKLYQILQKHADQSCEDFINLLKMTVSKAANDELKPSNIEHGHLKITESFSAISEYLSDFCEKFDGEEECVY